MAEDKICHCYSDSETNLLTDVKTCSFSASVLLLRRDRATVSSEAFLQIINQTDAVAGLSLCNAYVTVICFVFYCNCIFDFINKWDFTPTFNNEFATSNLICSRLIYAGHNPG